MAAESLNSHSRTVNMTSLVMASLMFLMESCQSSICRFRVVSFYH